MEFGDQEWLQKLKERVKFPTKVAFYFDKKDKKITARIVESKAKLDNVRYTDIKPTALAFQVEKDLAIIEVREVHSAKEYYDSMVEIQDEWKPVLEVTL